MLQEPKLACGSLLRALPTQQTRRRTQHSKILSNLSVLPSPISAPGCRRFLDGPLKCLFIRGNRQLANRTSLEEDLVVKIALSCRKLGQARVLHLDRSCSFSVDLEHTDVLHASLRHKTYYLRICSLSPFEYLSLYPYSNISSFCGVSKGP